MISGANEEDLIIATVRADVLLELQPKIDELKKENQELKKQLENCYCNRTDCSSRIKNSKKYDSLVQKVENQQKEFIKWLESEIKACELTCDLIFNHNKEMKIYKEILSKYKEIIGDKE